MDLCRSFIAATLVAALGLNPALGAGPMPATRATIPAAFTASALSPRADAALYHSVDAPTQVLRQEAHERHKPPRGTAAAEAGTTRLEFIATAALVIVGVLIAPIAGFAQKFTGYIDDKTRRAIRENSVIADEKKFPALWRPEPGQGISLHRMEDPEYVAIGVTERDPELVQEFGKTREAVGDLGAQSTQDVNRTLGTVKDLHNFGFGVNRAGTTILEDPLIYPSELPAVQHERTVTADVPEHGKLGAIMRVLGGIEKESKSLIDRYIHQLTQAVLQVQVAFAHGTVVHAQRVRERQQQWFELAKIDLAIHAVVLKQRIRRRIIHYSAESTGRVDIDAGGNGSVDFVKLEAEDQQLLELSKEREKLEGQRERAKNAFLEYLVVDKAELREEFRPHIPHIVVDREGLDALQTIPLHAGIDEQPLPTPEEFATALNRRLAANHAVLANDAPRDLFTAGFPALFWNRLAPVKSDAGVTEPDDVDRSTIVIKVKALQAAGREPSPKAEDVEKASPEIAFLKLKNAVLNALIAIYEDNKKSTWTFGLHTMLGLSSTLIAGFLNFQYTKPLDLSQTKQLIQKLKIQIRENDGEIAKTRIGLEKKFLDAQSRINEALRLARIERAQVATAAYYLTYYLNRDADLGGVDYLKFMESLRAHEAQLELHLLDAAQAEVELDSYRPATMQDMRTLYGLYYREVLKKVAAILDGTTKKVGALTRPSKDAREPVRTAA